MKVKSFVNRYRKFLQPLLNLKHIIEDMERYINAQRILGYKNNEKPTVYYIGVPVHANLGDLAQCMCIRRWLHSHYSDYHIVEIETDALVNTRFSALNKLKKVFNEKQDFILFQSGYTTTDLGGYADIMHQSVMKCVPNAKILMMPQTIFFKSEERKTLCSEVYNAHPRMLYLARDKISYEMACQMFPSIKVCCFPDIVTTLIGTVESYKLREGICFCLRNDSEKYYSDEELQFLIDKCKSFTNVNRLDTTKGNSKKVVAEAESYIYSEIKEYSKYKVMVTDRYHGTILSLVAGTPVVILQSSDYKVTTGADWFKGVYDDHVFLASDLDKALLYIQSIYQRNSYPTLSSYFEKEYYDKLPALFEETIK